MLLHKSLPSRTLASEVLSRFFLEIAQPANRSSIANSPQKCRSCYAQGLPSRRPLSTVTQYQPHTLNDSPPPPCNTGVPDTSIAGSTLDVEGPLHPPSKFKQKPPSSSKIATPYPASTQDPPSISVPESEAQKSKPISNPPSSSPSATASTATNKSAKPSRPSRLRSRKAAMSLTPSATAQLRNLLSQPEPKLIRVGVKNRGCSGLAYHLEYVDKPGTFDETVEQDGVKVLVDSKALFSIIGSEMDWVEDKLNQRFVFRNPNIKEQCGCGESFMV